MMTVEVIVSPGIRDKGPFMIVSEVQSSNVRRVGWDSGKLFVEYQNDKVYAYLDVPFDLYEESVSAPSVGRFINQEVKSKFVVEGPLDINPFIVTV